MSIYDSNQIKEQEKVIIALTTTENFNLFKGPIYHSISVWITEITTITFNTRIKFEIFLFK